MTANPLSPLNPVGGPPVPANGHAMAPRFTPLDPLRVIRQHLTLLVATLVTGLVIGMVTQYFLRRYAPEYSSKAKLVATGGLDSAYDAPSDPGMPRFARPDTIAIAIANQIAVLKSDAIIDEVLKREGVQQTFWFQSMATPQHGEDPLPARIAAVHARLEDDLLAVGIPHSTMIEVSLKGRYPDDLQRVLQSVIDVYLIQNRISAQSNQVGVQEVFTAEKRKAEAEILQYDNELRLTEVDMPLLAPKESQAARAYEAIGDDLVKVDEKLGEARDHQKALENLVAQGQVVASPEDMAVVEADQAVLSRDERLRQLREQRAVLLDRFGEGHREVRNVDLTMLAVEAERKQEVDRLLRERQQVNLGRARGELADWENQHQGLTLKMADAKKQVDLLTAQMSEAERLQSLLLNAKKREEEADRMLRNMQTEHTRPDSVPVQKLIDPTPADLTFPKAPAVVGGVTLLLTSLVMGLVFLKELLDQRIKSPADVKLLPYAELLGVLPEASDDPLGARHIESAVERDPSSLMAESFRQVRSAILSAMDRNGYKTLMVVGAHPGAGVSCVTQNLASSLAGVGKRVLVIESNFRRPAVHKLFNVPAEPGLVEVLRGTTKLDDAVSHRRDLGLDVLAIGDAGEATPELLETAAFSSLLHRAASRYDLVLIDAPPALLASESMLLARSVDAAAVVVRAMQEKRGAVGRMLRQLRGQRADVLGVIVNGVRSNAGGYFRKNYEEFYKYRQFAAKRAASVDQPGPIATVPAPDPAADAAPQEGA